MKKRKSSNFAVDATDDVEAGGIERERVAWRASATLPTRLYLVPLKNNSDAIADEESSRVRIHRSKNASAEPEALLLDIYVPRSAFAQKSNGTMESVSHGSKAKIGTSWSPSPGTSRGTRMPFSCHYEAAISDREGSVAV